MSAPAPLFEQATATGRLMAALDWAATPIGAPETWPESLRGAVRTVQSSRYPMLLLWGPEFTQLYNDAYSALIGDQHPSALGGDVRVTLAEGWPVLGPLIDEAMRTGVASWVPALQLLLERSGYREEAYFSVSHAPARDDGGVTCGVLTVCSEVTEQVVGERRLQLLRDLSVDDVTTASVEATCARLVATLAAHPADVPFAGLYLRDGDGLRLAGSCGADLPAVAAVGDDPWGLLGDAGRLGVPAGLEVVGGAFGDAVTSAVALPLPSADPRRPLGVLLAGVSPSRAVDDGYSSFHDLLAQQVSVALRNAQAYEEERARAQALAELDRVKTSFFTNVSHEFRTPLTLMLGPLEDVLADASAPLDGVQQERVETALRGARRLLKLVNSLLVFSGLEAGGVAPDSRSVDLAALTSGLAGSFRAAVERAGLVLEVRCPPLSRPVAVDPEQWEKVVGNLLSNALKFTFSGKITVDLTGDDEGVRLVVADTGVGIPGTELPRLFERFHRVAGTRSRSHEGSGIGLALVRELARLQGGDVVVESTVGVGSRFTVRLPWSALEVSGRGGPGLTDGTTVQAAVEEAESWTAATAAAGDGAQDGPRLLVADDNADMRDYLAQVLRGAGYRVRLVPDGAQALAQALADPPDLLLTDVMMPGLDGLELLRTLRGDTRTATLPVVVLSARAGEGASAEGLDLGADDYVVKPFTSVDLLARVRSTLQLARQRSSHVQQLDLLADAAAVITSGRQLEEVILTVLAQLRALLDVAAVEVDLLSRERAGAVHLSTQRDTPTGGQVLETALSGRHGRELGALRVRTTPGGVLPPAAHALLRPLAEVLAAVVEEAWHVEHESQVTGSLQDALLPDRLPEVPGLDLAARYRPADQDVQVGGDWYDVLRLPDGRVAISVGDVAGKGLTAALVMGQLRTAVRAYALEGLAPSAVVAGLDELVARVPGASFSTLFLGHLDVDTGALLWCSAGHPPPAVLGPDGVADWLEGEVTPPLGAGFGVPAVDNVSQVDAGSTLVLYTDGLVEDRASQLDAGMTALLGQLVQHAAAAPAGLVRTLLEAPGRRWADDTAVLVVRRRAGGCQLPAAVHDVDLSFTLPAVPDAASRMRARARTALQDAGLAEDVVFDLLLAASEAVNNAVEHAVAPTRPEVEVSVRVDAEQRRAEVSVRDHGSWKPRGSSMDRGRGSTLMHAAGGVTVTSGEDGTVVTVVRSLDDPAPLD